MSNINPTIVTSGLICCLDPYSVKSYPGSGTSVVNLAAASNLGTLVNGPTYSSGAFVFDGANDYILTNNTSLGNIPVISHSIWFYPTGAGIIVSEIGQTDPYSGWRDSNIEINSSGVISIATWNGSSLSNRVNSSAQPFNTWYNLTMTYSGTVLTAYINGVSIGTSTFTRGVPTNQFYAIGASNITNMGTSTNGIGKAGMFLVYNRALSAAEVLQNYNALKGRYGL